MSRRRQDSFVEALIAFPWWFNLLLALAAYMTFSSVLPSMAFSSPVVQAIAANMLPPLAWIPSMTLVLVALGSAFRSYSRGELFRGQRSLKDLKDLSPQAFEQYIGELYRRRGYSVQETGGNGPDGGVDLILKRDSRTIYVQCKRWGKKRVGITPTKELFATVVAENAAKGILITTSDFSADAYAFAHGQDELELICGRKLVRMMNA